MRKKILSMTLAGTLALTTITPTTAAAGDNDIGKFLFGALAILTVGKMIDNSQSNKAPAQVQQNQVQKTYRAPTRHPAPRIKHQRARVLPKHCVHRIDTWEGKRHLVGRRCLEQNYRHVQKLPRKCFRKFQVSNGRYRKGFTPRCLRNQGYVLR